jgi:tetratricopeptide (TPR) repeat protein
MSGSRRKSGLEKVIREYQDAVDATPGTDTTSRWYRGQALLKLAESLFRAGRLEEAAERFGEVEIMLSPFSRLRQMVLLSLSRRAEIYTELRRPAEALEMMTRVIELADRDPDSPLYLVPAGRSAPADLLKLLGRNDEADAAAATAIQTLTPPLNADEEAVLANMNMMRADFARNRHDYVAAVAGYEAALQHSLDAKAVPDLTWRATYGLGVSLQALGASDTALQTFETLIDKFRTSTNSNARDAISDARARVVALRFGGAATKQKLEP